MELNTETTLQLKKLLAQPAMVTQAHIPLLQNLIERYPYYQPLYLLLAKAGIGTENEQAWLSKAVIYNNGHVLHQVIHNSKTLTADKNITIIAQDVSSNLENVSIGDVDKEDLAVEAQLVNDTEESVDQIEQASTLTPEQAEEPSMEETPSAPEEEFTKEVVADVAESEAETIEPASLPVLKDEDISDSDLEELPIEPTVEEEAIEAPEIEDLPPLANEIISIHEDRPANVNEVEEELPAAEVITKPLEAPEIEGLPPLAWETLPMCEAEPTDNNTEQEEIDIVATVEEEFIETPEPISTPIEEETLSPIEEEVTEDDAEEIQKVDTETPEDLAETTAFLLPEIENLAPLESELNKVGLTAGNENLADNSSNETEEIAGFEAEDDVQLEQTEGIANPITTEEEEPVTELPEETELSNNLNAAIDDEKHDNIDVSERDQEGIVPIESITATDFFAFESNFKSESIADEGKNTEEKAQPVSNATNQHSENVVSKYDDDKMPFTFLWWLSKTRKDHEQIFMPFASSVKQASTASDLQQQYVENIFHLQSPFEGKVELDIPTTQKPTSKKSSLVEKFIKDDPQLKAPKPDQINTENKAKKSAEDNYDVVSETLADIYIEQMLYHKAIDTYQKLSLKFPEKSRYFADLILSLEKKI